MLKKIEKIDPLVLSGFAGYGKIVKYERGDPFALISADRTWPYGSSFSSFDCKKSGPIRKKLATVSVGHFSLEKRRLKNSHCYSRAFFP